MENKHKANAEKFVACLLTEGAHLSCDDTNDAFSQFGKLPSYFNKEKCKRGQQFFHKHIFAMFFGKMLGLLSVLSIPTVLNLLSHTNMSNTATTAYKRYMQTIYHMYMWYNIDFKPTSRLWKSLEEVRYKHNSASRRGCSAGLGSISQKDMAVTQFGFIGYVLTSTKQLGIHGATRQELEDIVHLWRVLGYILGIEERFNICRESLEETLEICRMLMQRQVKANMDRKDPNFFKMSEALINGLWCMNPSLQFNVFMGYLYYINLYPTNDGNNNLKPVTDFVSMNWVQKIHFQSILVVVNMMRYTLVKMWFNLMMYVAIWLMPRFPFLAFWSFGYENSKFYILTDRERKSG